MITEKYFFTCNLCRGSGQLPGPRTGLVVPCNACDGRGEVAAPDVVDGQINPFGSSPQEELAMQVEADKKTIEQFRKIIEPIDGAVPMLDAGTDKFKWFNFEPQALIEFVEKAVELPRFQDYPTMYGMLADMQEPVHPKVVAAVVHQHYLHTVRDDGLVFVAHDVDWPNGQCKWQELSPVPGTAAFENTQEFKSRQLWSTIRPEKEGIYWLKGESGEGPATLVRLYTSDETKLFMAKDINGSSWSFGSKEVDELWFDQCQWFGPIEAPV